jgi:hypothetical protein
MLNVLTLMLIVIHQNTSWLSLKSELKLFKFWTHQSHAYAYRVELPDGNYELVPDADEDLANAGVNAVEVQQGRTKVRRISPLIVLVKASTEAYFPFSNLCQYLYGCLCIYIQELNWNPSCMILGSYALILVC